MDKAKRKQMLDEFARQQLESFRKDLPMDENLFPRLFDFLDLELGKKDCDHTAALTEHFLHSNTISNADETLEWFTDHGGFCDCEILANVEDLFEYLQPEKQQPISKEQVHKRKINAVKTISGFRIDKVPAPWILTETLSKGKAFYAFQIGKGAECTVNLETAFPAEEFNNDAYWFDLWITETALSYKQELTIERQEFNNYSCIVIKSRRWSPVLYWFRNHSTDKWFLKMKTTLIRHKGDFKEISKLLGCIEIE